MDTIGLFFDTDAYLEPQKSETGPPDAPTPGMWGRHVAGKEFFQALLEHGSWNELVALVWTQKSAEALKSLWESHPATTPRGRRFRVFEEGRFHRDFLPHPPATVLHIPFPPPVRYAWARQTRPPGQYAISGVTHTLCDRSTVALLNDLLIGPFEHYDALICTSRAVVDFVRSLVGGYSDYLGDRFGGRPQLRIQLPLIPLGVDTERFRPADERERTAARHFLGIKDNEIAVLFVGRMSFHNKAHPFPIFRGLAEAARRTGKEIVFVLCGWTRNQLVRQAFIEGADRFAPGVRMSVVDGIQPDVRSAVWKAADISTSLVDNIQETFGLVIVEAMASGLPVVATDWNGYRDLVAHGETGFLVPTQMVEGATPDLTSRFMFQEIHFDQFIGECNQTVIVDDAAAAEAYTRLIQDPGLRRQMGAAGRERALSQFAWRHVIRAYEALWRDQDAERRAVQAHAAASGTGGQGPSCYPPVDKVFSGYPTNVLRRPDRLAVVPGAEALLQQLLAAPLTNYLESRRCHDASALLELLNGCASGCSLGDLEDRMLGMGVAPLPSRATVAWMIKYGLVRPVK